MKRFIAMLTLVGLLFFVGNNVTVAQDDAAPATEQVDAKPAGLAKVLKQKFIEGGAAWMTPVLICLILGLAVAIERIISLNLATANKASLLKRVDSALQAGNVEEAVEVAKSTRGPGCRSAISRTR